MLDLERKPLDSFIPYASLRMGVIAWIDGVLLLFVLAL